MASPWMNSFALIATAVLGLAALGSAALGIAVWLRKGQAAAALWLIPTLGTSFAVGGSWAGAFIAQRTAGGETPAAFWAWLAGLIVIGLAGCVLGLGTAASIQLRAEEGSAPGAGA